MRLFISFSLSVLLLIQTFNFGAKDVVRLGDLIEHAQLHSKQFGDSFFVFLNKHYGSLQDEHSASHEGHENLPFQHDQAQTTVNLFVLDILQTPDVKNPPVLHQLVNSFYTNTYTSLINQKIFQPPRYA